MRLLSYIFTIFLGVLYVSGVVFALSDSRAGTILKNFKALEKEMIFESDAVLLDDEDKSILSTYKKLSIYENIGDKVQSKREYLEQQNEKISSRVNSLEQSVAELDEDILDLVGEVNSINEQIVNTKSQVETNKETINLLKTKVSQSTEILLEYLVYIYKKGESVSS
jgi:chromosome segregation ATPase